MNTITIKNVPKNIVKEYWTVVSYEFFVKKIYNDKKNKITYWNDEEIDNMWKTSLVSSSSF